MFPGAGKSVSKMIFLQLHDLFFERGYKKRFWKDSGIAHMANLLLQLHTVVRGQKQNGHIRYCRPYPHCRLITVHTGHLPVQKDHVIPLFLLMGLLRHSHGVFPPQRRIDGCFGVPHKRLNAFAYLLVIVHCQDPPDVVLPKLLVCLSIRYAKLQFHRKNTSPVNLAGHLDRAAHKFYDVFRNRHAQTCSLNLVGGTVFRPGKGIENGL